MAPFSGGRITGESPPARLLHAGGRVGSVDAPPWSRAFGITSLTDMAGSIYRERSLRDPQHDGQRGGVAALQVSADWGGETCHCGGFSGLPRACWPASAYLRMANTRSHPFPSGLSDPDAGEVRAAAAELVARPLHH